MSYNINLYWNKKFQHLFQISAILLAWITIVKREFQWEEIAMHAKLVVNPHTLEIENRMIIWETHECRSRKKNEKVKKSSIIQPSYKKSNHNQNEKGN